MKETLIRRQRLFLLFVVISLIGILVACNSSTSDDLAESEGQTNPTVPDNRESSGDSAESSASSNSETSSQDKPTGQGEEQQDNEGVPASDLEIGSQGAALFDIDTSSVETDISGLTVGFTTDGHPFRGDPAAPVLMQEFSDFQCPFCARFYNQTLPSLEDNEIADGEAVLVYYDFPLVNSHPQAAAAANAARCAGEQGAANYWSMHDALFQNPGEWSNQNYDDTFMRYAENIGLELASYNSCLADYRYESEIDSDLSMGSALGITGTPTFVVNGELLVGAQPLTVFNAAILAMKEGGQMVITDSQPPPSQPPPSAAPTPAVFTEGFAGAMGDPNALVTIVEFTDYQCPYCSSHSLETMPQIVRDMVDTGRVYYILKDFPLDQIHPDARTAAVASRCASEQESYWEMHDVLFANQGEWAGQGDGAKDLFINYAATLGLDEESFDSCMDSGRHDFAIEANVQEGRSLGVSGTPHFFVDGYPLNGARPMEHFVAAVSLAEEGRLAEAFAPPPEQAAPGPVDISIENAFSIGDPDAPITIIEYTDFQCPYCSRHFQQTYPQIVDQYVDTGIVQYVFKDFPLTQIHPQALQASEAARCAMDQGAFLEMHDIIFNRQQEWGITDPVEVFTGYAGELDLDADAFSECLNSNQHEAAVIADLQEGVALGVTGTPSFFINGYGLTGAQPFEAFQQAIDSLMQQG
ncbi:MAG: thioredoxin domain-containing protein [Candidatus Promineifilaceae bacterium]